MGGVLQALRTAALILDKLSAVTGVLFFFAVVSVRWSALPVGGFVEWVGLESALIGCVPRLVE